MDSDEALVGPGGAAVLNVTPSRRRAVAGSRRRSGARTDIYMQPATESVKTPEREVRIGIVQ